MRMQTLPTYIPKVFRHWVTLMFQYKDTLDTRLTDILATAQCNSKMYQVAFATFRSAHKYISIWFCLVYFLAQFTEFANMCVIHIQFLCKQIEYKMTFSPYEYSDEYRTLKNSAERYIYTLYIHMKLALCNTVRFF